LKTAQLNYGAIVAVRNVVVERLHSTVRFAVGNRAAPLRANTVLLAASTLLTALSGACGQSATPSGNSIPIGASLPFTGNESSMGRNFEQAMLLAIEDVNGAGGIHGVPLSMDTRDSNSGSQRGLDDLLALIYGDKVQYLVGPDENELANDIVPDVKGLDILNILPGYAAPSTARVSATGAWMRLAPLPGATACAMAAHALDEGANRVNTLASTEDYNSTLATDFTSDFNYLTGTITPSVTIQTGQSSYESAISTVFGYGADRTLLVAYPETAAAVVTEAAVLAAGGSWYLSPLLNADVFLLNIPDGALEGAFGLSPSLSLASECGKVTSGTHGPVQCTQGNAHQFSDHFAARWNGARPFPAAYLYYDAVVLLAMGMQYSMATQGAIPAAQGLQQQILALNAPANDPGYWSDLKGAMSSLAQGKALRYIGAGAEYRFDQFGAAQYDVFDTWTVHEQSFIDTGAYSATCPSN
jgi:neutral amino acid transport system substrate-binding protein